MGITPADAGKTTFISDKVLNPLDHPRGCGENTVRPRLERYNVGSPPRMRGKPLSIVQVWSVAGITPADAGKTLYNLPIFHNY